MPASIRTAEPRSIGPAKKLLASVPCPKKVTRATIAKLNLVTRDNSQNVPASNPKFSTSHARFAVCTGNRASGTIGSMVTGVCGT